MKKYSHFCLTNDSACAIIFAKVNDYSHFAEVQANAYSNSARRKTVESRKNRGGREDEETSRESWNYGKRRNIRVQFERRLRGLQDKRRTDCARQGFVEKARQFTETPLAVGFGIGSADAAVAAAEHADAVIVGSAVVKRMLDGQMEDAMKLIRDMRDALDARYAH